MRSLHFHLSFGMDHRACAPPIRFRLLPTLWTGDLLVPPISMLQQQLPQHLSHQLPPQHRQLACYLIKVRLPMLFPPLPHLLKHLLCASHKFRLRLFSFHFAPPLLFSVPTPSLPPFSLAKNLGCTLVQCCRLHPKVVASSGSLWGISAGAAVRHSGQHPIWLHPCPGVAFQNLMCVRTLGMRKGATVRLMILNYCRERLKRDNEKSHRGELRENNDYLKMDKNSWIVFFARPLLFSMLQKMC